MNQIQQIKDHSDENILCLPAVKVTKIIDAESNHYLLHVNYIKTYPN